MPYEWVDIRDGRERPMACDMAQLSEAAMEREARSPRGLRGWLQMRLRDPSRRTH